MRALELILEGRDSVRDLCAYPHPGKSAADKEKGKTTFRYDQLGEHKGGDQLHRLAKLWKA